MLRLYKSIVWYVLDICKYIKGLRRDINVEFLDINVIFNNVISEICLYVCKINMFILKFM